MYRLVASLVGDVILEAHFHRGVAEADLQSLGEELIQLYSRCPIDLDAPLVEVDTSRPLDIASVVREVRRQM